MKLQDINEILFLENLCFPIPWSRQNYEVVLNNKQFKFTRLYRKKRLIGYSTLYYKDKEAELLNIAVHPAIRRFGYGKVLLDGVVEFCTKKKIENIFLEVRRSNVKAISLYTSFDFKEVGVKKSYYPDTKEDALIMKKEL